MDFRAVNNLDSKLTSHVFSSASTKSSIGTLSVSLKKISMLHLPPMNQTSCHPKDIAVKIGSRTFATPTTERSKSKSSKSRSSATVRQLMTHHLSNVLDILVPKT